MSGVSEQRGYEVIKGRLKVMLDESRKHVNEFQAEQAEAEVELAKSTARLENAQGQSNALMAALQAVDRLEDL